MAKFLVTYHAGDMPHDLEAMTKAREAFMQWALKPVVRSRTRVRP